MKVKFLKDHLGDKVGAVEDIPQLLANYLIRVGVAEEVKEQDKEEKHAERYQEKAEKVPGKEKAENKTGNVPTAKKKK